MIERLIGLLQVLHKGDRAVDRVHCRCCTRVIGRLIGALQVLHKGDQRLIGALQVLHKGDRAVDRGITGLMCL
jgi:hypothetical protein